MIETLAWAVGILAALVGLGEAWWANARAEARRPLPEEES